MVVLKEVWVGFYEGQGVQAGLVVGTVDQTPELCGLDGAPGEGIAETRKLGGGSIGGDEGFLEAKKAVHFASYIFVYY